MNPTLILQAMIALLTLVNVGCAVYVARRTLRWRESDEAKAFVLRVQAIEAKVGGIDERGLSTRLGEVEDKVIAIEARLESMATKADVDSLKSDVRHMSRELEKIDSGVTRIESWLMERGK